MTGKIVVLAGGGMLGHKLCERFSAAGRDVIATFRKPVSHYDGLKDVFGRTRLVGNIDVMDRAALETFLKAERPAVVVNCVGIIKQLETIDDRLVTVGVNSYLPHMIEKICGEVGARMVHFSTDCVFSGKKGSYRATDPSDAGDLYGRSKFLGETAGVAGQSITIRSSVIGREISKPNYGLVEWIYAQKGKRVRGFGKAIYTGLTTIEMSRVVELAIERTEPLLGVWHVASAPINKYDLLKLVSQKARLKIEIDRYDDFVCDRSLIMDRFADETGYHPASWEAMIEEMVVDGVRYDRY